MVSHFIVYVYTFFFNQLHFPLIRLQMTELHHHVHHVLEVHSSFGGQLTLLAGLLTGKRINQLAFRAYFWLRYLIAQCTPNWNTKLQADQLQWHLIDSQRHLPKTFVNGATGLDSKVGLPPIRPEIRIIIIIIIYDLLPDCSDMRHTSKNKFRNISCAQIYCPWPYDGH